MPGFLSKAVQSMLLVLIRGYQLLLSPWIGRQCRFYPTCSVYTAEAIETHGPWRGALLGVRRLGKCHPYHEGGVDLVPEAFQESCPGHMAERSRSDRYKSSRSMIAADSD